MAKLDIIEKAKTASGKLTTFQKYLIAGVVVIIFAGIILLVFSSAKPKKVVLYSELDQKEAGKIVNVLKEREIEYELADNGSTILVDKENLYNTRLSLANDGLPESGIVGYELFDRTNLGMSEYVQKINFRRALEGEIARTIASMDEVKKVRVHLVIPEKALFEKDQKKPSASVNLHLKTGKSLGKVSIDGIQNLVSSSVEGMTPAEVTVVDQRGKILSPLPLDESSVAGLTAKQHDQQRQFEQYLAQKVQSLLDGVLGAGNSEVRVNSELDFTQTEKTITDYDPERAVTRSEQSINENVQSTDSLSYPAVNMNKVQSNVIQNYEITKQIQHIVEGVGGIKRLSVACLINGTFKVTEKDNQKNLQYIPRSDEQMQKLTEIVKNAVGYDPMRNDQVSVLNVPFDTYDQEDVLQDLKSIPWWRDPENIKLLILIFAMLLIIYLMYRLLQSKQVKEKLRIAFSLPETIKVEDEEEEEIPFDELELFEPDELLLLPAELPEQLLLEGEPDSKIMVEDEEEEAILIDKDSLANRAGAKLEETEGIGMTEDTLLKLEMKNRIEEYVDDQTVDAVRILRLLLAQDLDEKGIRW